MDPRFYLRLAPYAVILTLILGLWGTYNWGSGHKIAREAAETALVTLRDAYITASKAVENLKKERENAIADAITQARDLERQTALANEARLRAAVAAERRDARSLRDQLASRLSCPAGAAQNSAATGVDQTTAIGDVLAEALRIQAELAGAAEGHAGEVRSLQDAWPR